MRKFEKVSRIEEDIRMPERATEKSAGYDFFAIEDIIIEPIEHKRNNALVFMGYADIIEHENIKPKMIRTGVKVKMPDDEFLMLVNRSSNPLKKNLILANGVGIIDADYYGNPYNDGEMMFPFYNIGTQPILINKGDKLGQGIFIKFGTTVDDAAEGNRIGGFGSTDN